MALFLLLGFNAAEASPAGYTQYAPFIANVPAVPAILTFENAAANGLIPSGAVINGISFGYNLGGVSLKVSTVTDTSYSTTSAVHFLGTDDADILQDGDALAFAFPPVNSFGLYVISNDEMVDGDIVLNAGGASVGLVAADVQGALADGSQVYFLGISNPTGMFAGASLTTAGNGAFLFNIDDIVTAVAPMVDTDGDGIPDGSDNCPATPNGPAMLHPDDNGISQRNTDGDAQGDACDADDDNDGLTDVEEAALGTSRLNADTDGDGVSDGDEVANGTNPLEQDNCDLDSTAGPSVGDLLLLQQHLAGEITLSEAQQSACDLYPDGKLTISDQLRLEQLLTAP